MASLQPWCHFKVDHIYHDLGSQARAVHDPGQQTEAEHSGPALRLLSPPTWVHEQQ